MTSDEVMKTFGAHQFGETLLMFNEDTSKPTGTINVSKNMIICGGGGILFA